MQEKFNEMIDKTKEKFSKNENINIITDAEDNRPNDLGQNTHEQNKISNRDMKEATEAEATVSDSNAAPTFSLNGMIDKLLDFLDEYFDVNKKDIDNESLEVEKLKAVENTKENNIERTTPGESLNKSMKDMEAQDQNGIGLENNPAEVSVENRDREKELEKIDQKSANIAEQTMSDKGEINESSLGKTDIASQHDASSTTSDLEGVS